MNNNELDDSLDLLDLEDDAALDTLPEASPFASAPRPKKPWLLMGVGLLVVVLATYIIVRTVGSDSGSSVEIDLDAPEVVTTDTGATDTLVVPDAPSAAPLPVPVAASRAQPMAPTPGVPVREVSDRREVTFNPDKPAAKPAPAAVVAKPKAPAPKPAPAAKSAWYAQFGSYSARAMAESAQRRIQSGHGGLFAGKQFVILAATLPNGATTYRLRVGFASSGEANGFCQNAKSDGLDCYVAK
ncbi:MAG: SPOR domain-containing protein [Rickettsiales bacterium]|nr:SPOR domain-containing protein [Rickettsiales bacterium]